MDINIKGGGITRTVKCNCPEVKEFPIRLGNKVSDAEVASLNIKFDNVTSEYNTVQDKKVEGTGLTVIEFTNNTSNKYLVFYNIPMQHSYDSTLPYNEWSTYTTKGAFMIMPYETISHNTNPRSLFVPKLRDFPYSNDFWEIAGTPSNNPTSLNEYLQVYKIY